MVAPSNIVTSSSEEESSEEDEPQVKSKKKAKDLTGLYFMANDNNNSDPELDPTEVLPSYNQLSIQVDTLNDALVS